MNANTTVFGIQPPLSGEPGKTNVIRMEIQLCDPIDGAALRRAVDTTIKRYPYFAVMLQKEENTSYFRENERTVTVSNSE